jgi:hypothetical protein
VHVEEQTVGFRQSFRTQKSGRPMKTPPRHSPET